MKKLQFTIMIEVEGEPFSTVIITAGCEVEANARAREYVQRCHPVLTDADVQTFAPMS